MVNFSDNNTPSRAPQAAAMLARIVAEHGRDIVSDPRRVDGLLRDYCPEARREVNLLTTALREGVAKELAASLTSAASQPAALLVPRLVGRLEQEHGMAAAAAQWAIETWAAALGLGLSHPPPPLARPPVATPEQRQAASAALVSLWTDDAGDYNGAKAAAMTAEAVRAALDAGADVEARDKNDRTALMWAAWNGHTEIVRLLLQAGADLEARNTDGKTALMWAAQNGQTEIVRLLLEAGADVEARNTDGWTALMRAAWNGDTEAVRLLLEAGADVEARTTDGDTALMRAASWGRTEAVRLLLEAGADVEARTTDGRTALMIAAQSPAKFVSKERKGQTIAALQEALIAKRGSLPSNSTKINKWLKTLLRPSS